MNPRMKTDTCPERKMHHLCLQNARPNSEASCKLGVVGAQGSLLNSDRSQEKRVGFFVLALLASCNHDRGDKMQRFAQTTIRDFINTTAVLYPEYDTLAAVKEGISPKPLLLILHEHRVVAGKEDASPVTPTHSPSCQGLSQDLGGRGRELSPEFR